MTLRLTDEKGFDLEARHADGHVDVPRMREGGLDAEFLSVWVKPTSYRGEAAWSRARQMFDAIHAAAARHPESTALALTAADIRTAAADGRIALLIGVEGGHALGALDDEELALRRIRELHGSGARYMTLTWTNSSPLAGASGDGGRRSGLTKLGRRAIRLMNDLGMMVDLSHVSDRSFFDALEASRLPVIVSHSAMRALAAHPRNVTDEMARAVAKNGGALCINFYAGFLDSEWMAARRRAKAAASPLKAPAPSIDVLVDHIERAVQVAGPDHVCLGSDFDGAADMPAGLEDSSRLPALTSALLERGITAEAVRKILGGNLLRVMEANERGAARGENADHTW